MKRFIKVCTVIALILSVNTQTFAENELYESNTSISVYTIEC